MVTVNVLVLVTTLTILAAGGAVVLRGAALLEVTTIAFFKVELGAEFECVELLDEDFFIELDIVLCDGEVVALELMLELEDVLCDEDDETEEILFVLVGFCEEEDFIVDLLVTGYPS